MDNQNENDLRLHYFDSLRKEILQTRARIYRTLLAGIIGSPILTYFAMQKDSHVLLILLAPFLVMMILILYISEQASMMQIGRYIKEKVEKGEDGWEHWLSTRRDKFPEPPLYSTFALLCMIFYIILICFAFQRVTNLKHPTEVKGFESFMYEFWGYGLPVLYIIGTFWVFFTLLHFWRSALKT